MGYDNYKKQAPRYWREAEMLAYLEAAMSNATSMTELKQWYQFSITLSATVKGFSAKLIECKDRNKMRLNQEESARQLAEAALGVPVKATRIEGHIGISGHNGANGQPGYNHGDIDPITGLWWNAEMMMWDDIPSFDEAQPL